MQLPAGTTIAHVYEILHPLGRGGMGEVYAARNVRTERRVAVKVLRPDTKHRGDAIERLEREARALGMIESEHVLEILAVDDDPIHGVVLSFELLEGESFLERLRARGTMDFNTLYPIVRQVLLGLSAAHRAGIIHRDLKPSNVFIARKAGMGEHVKILDFGISKLPRKMVKSTLTEPNQTLGSFAFMPPEQIHGSRDVDHRADLYAVGTLAFQAMSGFSPFVTNNVAELMRLKSEGTHRTLSQVTGRPVSQALEEWIATALAPDPNRRFSSADATLAAWDRLAGVQVGPQDNMAALERTVVMEDRSTTTGHPRPGFATTTDRPAAAAPQRVHPLWFVLGAVIAIAALGLCVWFGFSVVAAQLRP